MTVDAPTALEAAHAAYFMLSEQTDAARLAYYRELVAAYDSGETLDGIAEQIGDVTRGRVSRLVARAREVCEGSQ